MAANQPREAVASEIVAALRRTGLLLDADKETALAVVTAELGRAEGGDRPRQAAARGPRLAEIGGYVGAALVMAAVALLLAQQWGNLSVTARIAWLGGIAATLAIATFVMAAIVGPRRSLATDAGARRHLVAILTVVTAVATAGAVGVGADAAIESDPDGLAVRLALWSALAVLIAVYALAPHGLLQAAAALVAFWLLIVSFQDVAGGFHWWLSGTSCLLGVTWLVLAESGHWRERTLARLVGGVFLFFAAQALGFWGRQENPLWWSYVATFAVACAGLAMYLWRDDWAYLVVGVIALTVAVTQALVDWTGGSLGAGGAVLAAGLTMLAASAFALWLRRRRARSVSVPEASAHRIVDSARL